MEDYFFVSQIIQDAKHQLELHLKKGPRTALQLTLMNIAADS